MGVATLQLKRARHAWSHPATSLRTVTSLPNLLELWFRSVFALPNASSNGLLCMSKSCMLTSLALPPPCTPAISARKRKTCLEFSVFPEPDSPEVTRV